MDEIKRISETEVEVDGVRYVKEEPDAKQEAESEEDWIRTHLKPGALIEVRDNVDTDYRWHLREYVEWSSSGIFVTYQIGEHRFAQARLPRNRLLFHHGGPMPVPSWLPVKAVLRGFHDGRLYTSLQPAEYWNWDWSGPNNLGQENGDVIAYLIPDADD